MRRKIGKSTMDNYIAEAYEKRNGWQTAENTSYTILFLQKAIYPPNICSTSCHSTFAIQ